VIEERATSIPLYAGQVLTVDPYGNLIIESEGAS